jgi:hypothetical protein
LEDTADDLEERALAAAVGSDDAEDFAAFDGEVDVAEGPEFLAGSGAAEGEGFDQAVHGALVEAVGSGDVLNVEQT